MAELKHVKGLSDMLEALRAFPPKLRRKTLAASTIAAAKTIRDQARQNAPVDTGLLRKDIIYKRIAERCTPEREVYAVLVRKSKGHAFYWRFIEFGTSKVPPRPFMRPAVLEKQEEAVEKFAEVLRAKVDGVARDTSR